MGLMGNLLDLVFGGRRNILAETAEVFRENAEAGAVRAADLRLGAMTQFAAEFAAPRAGLFDRIMDAVNRLPRPALALGTLALFVAAMVDPLWFAARMQGLALVPEPLWWLLGVVVSFYFGARHQLKAQSFQREIAATVSRAPQVAEAIAGLGALRATTPGTASAGRDATLALAALEPEGNAALEDWKALRC